MVCRIGLRAEGRFWSENVAGLENKTKLDIHVYKAVLKDAVK